MWPRAGTGIQPKTGVAASVGIAAKETGDCGASPSQAWRVKSINLQSSTLPVWPFRYVPLRCDPHFSACSSKENFDD